MKTNDCIVFDEDEVIFNYGDIGTKFYVIIKGKVSINVLGDVTFSSKDEIFKNLKQIWIEDEKRFCETTEDLKHFN
jgi:CRP-like cAMP-binding protein